MNTTSKHGALVYAIVLTYNNYDDTAHCVESLLDSEYPNLEIIIVDNASTDGTAQKLAEKFPGTVLIQNICNLGFAVGNNVGIQFAHENGADYFLIVNNDTLAAPDTISALVRAADADESIAAVAPKIVEHDDPHIISFAGGLLHLWKGSTQHIGQGEVDRGQYNEMRDCDYLTGAFLLVKRKIIEEIGVIPDMYFMYWEDVDWSMRMRQAGYRLCYVPGAVVTHKVSSTARTHPFRSILIEYRGAKIFIRRWIKGLRKVTAHLYRFIYLLRRIVYSLRIEIKKYVARG